MPTPNEVQAALDMLFVSRSLRWDMEHSMWHQANSNLNAPSKLSRFFGKRADPMPVMWTKTEFDERFKDIVTVALKQCEKVREGGKTPTEIYPVNAHLVQLGNDRWAVEVFMSSKKAERIDGFKDGQEAHEWIRKKSEDFVVNRGLPKGTKVLCVGEEYY
jgi:hypothetical protein